MKKLRFAYVRFTSCSGCQLTLLNCEQELGDLDRAMEWIAFSMASSRRDDAGHLDAVLVEGSISRPEEIIRLLELRHQAGVLVAVGACALTGGVNALGGGDRMALSRKIYGETAGGKSTFPPQPVSHFVRVDLEIAGCPPEGGELLRTIGALVRSGLPALPEYPVCMECRQRENSCLLLEKKEPCLGPVIRAGCNALCPTIGIPCEGCRGHVLEANRDEQFRLLFDLGLSEREVRRRMERFAGDRDAKN